MTVGFGGMLVFLGIALWLLKRQPAAERTVAPPRSVASAPAPAPTPAPVADALAFEPTMFASTAVSEADAPNNFDATTDKTEFIPTGPPTERTEIVQPPHGRG